MNVYKFQHPKLGEEMEAISGHYSIEKEDLFTYKGREVLYYTGYSVVDTSCCGPGGCGFAFVVGYVIDLKNDKNENGVETSDIEPISDTEQRQEIRRLLTKQLHVQQVNFWLPQTLQFKP